MDVLSKSTGDSYTAPEFNQSNNELENLITSAGITLSSGDLFQLGKAIANYSAHGDFYSDSGAADAYVLGAGGSKQSPTAYVDGMRVRFVAGNTNTAASTVNVATLGVVDIRDINGVVLVAGAIRSGGLIEMKYDNASGDFFITNSLIGHSIQAVNVQDGEVATGTTIIPFDDSIPQNTEGDEYMTLAIIPRATTNKLKIDIVINLAHSSTGQELAVALFQDATANALAAAWGTKDGSANQEGQVTLTHYMDAGTTSSTTFKVRAGAPIAGTTTVNGSGGARIFGGVMASSITITEVKA